MGIRFQFEDGEAGVETLDKAVKTKCRLRKLFPLNSSQFILLHSGTLFEAERRHFIVFYVTKCSTIPGVF